MKIPFWASSCVSMCKPATLDETEWLLICRIMQQPNLIQLTCSRWRWLFVFYHGDHVMTSISLGILPSHRTNIEKYEGSKPIASCWVQEEAGANRSFVEAGSQSSLLEDAERVHVCIYRFSGFCKCTGKYNAQKKPCTKFVFHGGFCSFWLDMFFRQRCIAMFPHLHLFILRTCFENGGNRWPEFLCFNLRRSKHMRLMKAFSNHPTKTWSMRDWKQLPLNFRSLDSLLSSRLLALEQEIESFGLIMTISKL